ncbi:hypothetical protein LIA77_11304 [Sarocladium implicatum]|nr:hypothetical protein LIA77_11304 [Sarocladium implicatum]
MGLLERPWKDRCPVLRQWLFSARSKGEGAKGIRPRPVEMGDGRWLISARDGFTRIAFFDQDIWLVSNSIPPVVAASAVHTDFVVWRTEFLVVMSLYAGF